MSNTGEKIKQVVIERLEINEDDVTMDADIQKDLGADSITVVEMIIELEDAFDIDIPDEEAEKLRTIRDVVDYVQSRLAESEA